MRVLSLGEESMAIERAREYARRCGVIDPDESDPFYRVGLHVAVIVIGLVDHASPNESPVAFFESEAQVHGCAEITLDEIEYAFARYMLFADSRGVRKVTISDDEFMTLVARSAGGDTLPFFEMRPGTQSAFITSLASLYLVSLRNRSGSTSHSEGTTPTNHSDSATVPA